MEQSRALDVGCAVGRSTFELARGLKEVIGIDYSQSFIDAADILRSKGQMPYNLVQEGDLFSEAVATVPKDIVSLLGFFFFFLLIFFIIIC